MSSLTRTPFGAVYFTVGTLTRSPKIVYGLGVLFYPVYITSQVLLKPLPTNWRLRLDPLLVSWPGIVQQAHGAEWENAASINQLTFNYDSDVIINRVLALLIAAVSLSVLYFRFKRSEPTRAEGAVVTLLDLSDERETVFAGEGGQTSVSRVAPALQPCALWSLELRRLGWNVRLSHAHTGAQGLLPRDYIYVARARAPLLPEEAGEGA
jgi:hypothetical protein